MAGSAAFKETTGCPISRHIIVALDGEYIDLTFDQFGEDGGYVAGEPIESGGRLGKRLNQIRLHADGNEQAVCTRRIIV